jgi:membrane fusion protein (multidrug efflux system)
LFAWILFGFGWVACRQSTPVEPPPLEIAVARVVQRDQPLEMEMVGETLGSADIPIRARVAGELTGMFFTEGRTVEAGQLLYTIDPEPFESEVVEAEGSLAEARTRLAKARADLDRIRPLAEMNAVSQSDLDGAIAQYEAALGSLQSAEARVDQTKIRLGYTKLHSPIAGRIGISQARVGEFVGQPPNPVVLTFVSKTDPIRVRFSIDERTYLRLARRLRELQAPAPSPEAPAPEARLDPVLRLVLADGTVHPAAGRIVAADASVDPKTGTFTLEADFPNPDGLVLAGQFAMVRAVAEVRKDALLVPARSVNELQGLFRVFVVGDDGEVELRSVVLGPAVDGFRIVESGLRPGERVALELVKLRPGMKIVPRPVELDARGMIVDPPPEEARPGRPTGGGPEHDDAMKKEG